MVEFSVGQPREPSRRPQKQHHRLGVEGQTVQAVAVARTGDPTGQILDLLGGKYAVNKRQKRAYPHNAFRGEAFASANASQGPSPYALS
jgi:hypothetical protein